MTSKNALSILFVIIVIHIQDSYCSWEDFKQFFKDIPAKVKDGWDNLWSEIEKPFTSKNTQRENSMRSDVPVGFQETAHINPRYKRRAISSKFTEKEPASGAGPIYNVKRQN